MSQLSGNKILVIDDDPDLLQLVKLVFSRAGGQVSSAASGPEGLRQFYDYRPDLVILDLMMPEMDGCEVCRHIRKLSDVPLILLTAMNQDDQMERCLACSADDYVTKPFRTDILVARAQAVLRRAALPHIAEKSITYNDGYLAIHLDRRQVLVQGQSVALSATEYRLLAYLLQNANQVLTFQQILTNVWGEAYQDNIEYVYVYIWHLRQKLEADRHNPIYLLTEHGVGYRFEKQAQLVGQ